MPASKITPLENKKGIDMEVYMKLPAFLEGQKCVVYGHNKIPAYTMGIINRTASLTAKQIAVKIAGTIYLLKPDYLYVSKKDNKAVVVVEDDKYEPFTLPAGIRKAAFFAKSSIVVIYGHKDYKAGTIGKVAIFSQPTSNFIQLEIDGKPEYVKPSYLFQKDPTYVAPGPLFTDFAGSSELMKYMADLLYAENMNDSITLALQGVDLKDYKMISSQSGSKWAAIIPKDAKGPLPVLMAHCDIQMNVKHPTPENLEYDTTLEKFNSPRGLGADDRAGLFVINRALSLQPGKFIAIFFDEEEVGCRGSRNFVTSKDFRELIDPIASTYISIDRTRAVNGDKTVATYGHDNKDLLKLFKDKSGRKDVNGSSTDCKILSAESAIIAKDGEGVACVNFSCGYQYEHTARETLYWKELLECAVDISQLPTKIPELWEKQFRAPKAIPYYSSGYNKNRNKKQETTSPAHTRGSQQMEWFGDFVEHEGEYYASEDIKILMQYYKLYTGKDYTIKTASPYTPKRSDFVRLSATVSVGGIYGGRRLDKATHIMLDSNVWAVHSVDLVKSTANLVTDDGSYNAANIPFAVLESVTQEDMLVSQNLFEGDE